MYWSILAYMRAMLARLDGTSVTITAREAAAA